jgi:hypothetical protein
LGRECIKAQSSSCAADRVCPDRRGAGIASLVRAARAHGPRVVKLIAGCGAGGERRDAVMPSAPLAGIRVRSRTRARAPGRLGSGNATAGRPLWSSSPRHGRGRCPERPRPVLVSR